MTTSKRAMTPDEARGLLADSEQPPTVRWLDKRKRWRYARLVKVGREWATLETGGGDLPTRTHKVRLAELRERKRRAE